MRILFLNYMHASLPTLIRSLELARGTARCGHRVTLAFLHPEFRPPRFFLDLCETYRGEGLDIIHPAPRPAAGTSPGRITEARPSLAGLFRQTALSLRYVPREMRLLRRLRPDAVVARPDQVLSFVVSCRLTRTPLVLDTDGPVEELDTYWGIPSGPFVPIDTWRARRAGAVLHVSRVCGDLWRSKGIPEDRLLLCPNAADPDRFEPSSGTARRELRSRLGLGDAKVIGFAGNQRTWHGVRDLLQAVLRIAGEAGPGGPVGPRLLLVGEMEDRAALGLEDLPRDEVARRVVFAGRVPPPLDLFHFSPMKMYEGLAAGKTIVGPRQGQVEEVLGAIDPGCLYDPRDPEGLAAALRRALDAPRSLGEKGASLLRERHTWKHRGEVVGRACERAVAAAPRRPAGGSG